ncbi:Overexpressed in colon carcinoma 1 protein -like protein [Collichthys lucidus]|uniref:Overexpressed in colon carcinoma 1 protein-like protein n=1 Tax=Collichthys lucidus TaxID=240159 RepID=A0A4U5UHL1_COLLU|nr:Overexpressed in colon carcinoma 1 protein -like protein [Collichthys lucidus]
MAYRTKHCEPQHIIADELTNLLNERTEDPTVEDEKRRNYGGVYVGLPADLTTVAASQSKSTHKGFCIFIHPETSREDVSVLSLAHHTLEKKKKVSLALTLSLNGGCGQLARAPRTLPPGVMGGTGIRSGACRTQCQGLLPQQTLNCHSDFSPWGLKDSQDIRYSHPIELNLTCNARQRRGGPVQHVVPFRAGLYGMMYSHQPTDEGRRSPTTACAKPLLSSPHPLTSLLLLLLPPIASLERKPAVLYKHNRLATDFSSPCSYEQKQYGLHSVFVLKRTLNFDLTIMAKGQQVSRQGSGAAYVTAQLLFKFTAYVLTCEIVTERGVKMSKWDRQTDGWMEGERVRKRNARCDKHKLSLTVRASAPPSYNRASVRVCVMQQTEVTQKAESLRVSVTTKNLRKRTLSLFAQLDSIMRVCIPVRVDSVLTAPQLFWELLSRDPTEAEQEDFQKPLSLWDNRYGVQSETLPQRLSNKTAIARNPDSQKEGHRLLAIICHLQ